MNVHKWGVFMGGLLLGLTVGFVAVRGPWLLRLMNGTARIQQISEVQDVQCRDWMRVLDAQVTKLKAQQAKR